MERTTATLATVGIIADTTVDTGTAIGLPPTVIEGFIDTEDIPIPFTTVGLDITEFTTATGTAVTGFTDTIDESFSAVRHQND